MDCPNCHASATPTARYCSRCGTRLTDDESDDGAELQHGNGSRFRSHEPDPPHAVLVTQGGVADETLRSENRYYASLFELSAVGVAQIDSRTGRFCRINQHYCEMLGYTSTEMLTLDVQTITHPDDLDENLENLARLRAGDLRQFHLEKRYFSKNGTVVWVRKTVLPLWSEGEASDFLLAFVDDITEQRQLEESLRLAQFSIDCAVDSVYWVGPNAEILYANQTACRTLGYSREELVRMTIHDIDPGFPAEVWPAHWEDLKQRRAFSFESAHRTKDGGLINVEVTVNYMNFEGREYNCATTRDITQRKRLEQSLRLAQFSIDCAVDSVYWVGPNAEIHYVNDAACRTLGYSREELLGKTVFDINPNLSLGAWPAYWEGLKQRGTFFIESVQRTKDGDLINTEINVNYINFEGREYACGTTRDITQRKQAEQLLLQSEERFRQITQAIQEAFWIASADTTKVYYVSPAYELIWGRSCQSLIDNPQTFVDSIHAEDRDRVVAGLAVKSEGVPFEHEYRIVRPDGSIRWILDRGFPVLSTAKTDACYVGVAQDVTQRKEAELQASILRDELAHVARAGTISELATGLAHELNQPLTSLGLYASTALELARGSESAELKNCLQRIVDLSLRAGEIVRRIRSFITRGPFRRERADINRLVNEVLSLLEGDLKKSGTKTNFVAGKQIPAVLVDGVQIQQVLVNLIRNAMEAMLVGPQNRPRSLTIRTQSIDDEVRVSVTDSGSGLDPTIADKLFHPFQTTKPRGLGLGLSICRNLIEAQGGHIGAESNPDGGMTFIFLLPAAWDQADS
jgi:PAS domain S-box-containing protein